VKYSKKEGIQDDETYEKTGSGWQWTESQSDIDLTLTNINKTQTSADLAGSTQNIIETQDLLVEDTSKNQEKNQIQSDEPDENGEVLGAETIKNNEKFSDSKGISGNFFQRIFWSTNQFINNLINLFF
jgi:hypothetical protein